MIAVDVVTAFEAALPATVTRDPAIADALERMIARARTAWPDLDVPLAAFAAHVAARIAEAPGVVEQVDRAPAGDLWLACACTRGDSRAIAAFEAAYAPEIRAALRRLRDRPVASDDVQQLLRHRLFVGDGAAGPAIARYSGHGNLGAWVRVTAMRTVLNATRNRPAPDEPGGGDDAFEFAPSPDDPELDHLKRTYRDAFRQAFLDTVAALPASERTLLRQSVVHGLTVRALAQMHGVHHATVARRIAAAREQLVAGTREILAARLAIGARELDSIMALIRSRLDVSLVRALGAE